MFKTRLVHIDLKGGAFRPEYWRQLIPFFSRIGINGLLIEYEDMFPYNEYLDVINCKDVYDRQQIESIIGLANEYNLRIIPLIQTFGHLEFVLKHHLFKDLREVETYPNSICPSNDKSLELIKDMVRQMVSMHQKWTQLDAIHIGCDEVWHLGYCQKCQQYLQNSSQTNKTQLFINFVAKIAEFIRNTFNIKVIVWDDMLRNADNELILRYNLNKLVEPMVWHYLDINSFQLRDEQFWQKYKQLFEVIWIASCFKGAAKMNQTIPPINYHISNQLAWIQVIDANQLSIEGVALTGWQRFDHFTTLCELFPNSIISLIMSLFAINENNFNQQIQEKASKLIGNKCLIPIEINGIRDLESIDSNLYPGSVLFKLTIEWLFMVNEFNTLKNNQSLEGAFTSYQVMTNRTNPLHIEAFLLSARILLFRVREQKFKIETEMKSIFFDSTIDEWIQTNINPILKKLDKIVSKADQQLVIHLNSNQL